MVVKYIKNIHGCDGLSLCPFTSLSYYFLSLILLSLILSLHYFISLSLSYFLSLSQPSFSLFIPSSLSSLYISLSLRPIPPDKLAMLIDEASENNITIAILTQVHGHTIL